MALLNKKNNYYIKIDLKGNYIIYKSKEARQLEKQTTSPAVISKKYWDLLTSATESKELLYYSPKDNQHVLEIEAEHKKYLQNLNRYVTTEKYPIMKKYIEDVEESIPQIISKGHVKVRGNTLEEVYNFVKKYEVFGDTEDDL